jgi:hypothetical protein
MGAAKTKNTNWFSRNKTVVFILAGSFLVLILLGFLYYQSQHPNYRDLEKEFNTLQIPSDWQLTKSKSNEGALGLFCLQNVGEECPYLINEYSSSFISRKEMKETAELIVGKPVSEGDINSAGCPVEVILEQKYNCEFFVLNNNILVTVTFSDTDSFGNKATTSSINLSKQ